ncbi:MAG: hypothetical protein GXY44_08395 [Phycisphaerales bacterium]|nr:hypothetical protein [Phycisphaerales bacterium]
MARKSTSICLGWVAVACMLVGACSKDSDAPHYKPVEGRVVSIDKKSGLVTLALYDAKTHQEKILEGTLDPNAEIFIDGKTARPEDVFVNDLVRIDVLIEKHEGLPRYVAKKVEVLRGADASEVADSQPAEP